MHAPALQRLQTVCGTLGFAQKYPVPCIALEPNGDTPLEGKALEEQKRKKQMPRKLSDRLQWGRERSQEHNMQQKKNKIKHKEMEL